MSTNTNIFDGNIDMIILYSLSYGDKYGYEIARTISDNTEDNTEIKQPTLYAYLKKLESKNSITSYWGEESKGGRRRYYKISDLGMTEIKEFLQGQIVPILPYCHNDDTDIAQVENKKIQKRSFQSDDNLDLIEKQLSALCVDEPLNADDLNDNNSNDNINKLNSNKSNYDDSLKNKQSENSHMAKTDDLNKIDNDSTDNKNIAVKHISFNRNIKATNSESINNKQSELNVELKGFENKNNDVKTYDEQTSVTKNSYDFDTKAIDKNNNPTSITQDGLQTSQVNIGFGIGANYNHNHVDAASQEELDNISERSIDLRYMPVEKAKPKQTTNSFKTIKDEPPTPFVAPDFTKDELRRIDLKFGAGINKPNDSKNNNSNNKFEISSNSNEPKKIEKINTNYDDTPLYPIKNNNLNLDSNYIYSNSNSKDLNSKDFNINKTSNTPNTNDLYRNYSDNTCAQQERNNANTEFNKIIKEAANIEFNNITKDNSNNETIEPFSNYSEKQKRRSSSIDEAKEVLFALETKPEPIKNKESIQKNNDKQNNIEKPNGNEYKKTLHSLLGDQIEAMQKEDNRPADTTFDSEIDYDLLSNLNLSQLADYYAKEGIKLKLFNNEISSYHPAKILYPNKLNMVASLFASFIVFFELIILYFIGSSQIKNFDGIFLVLFGLVVCIAPVTFAIILLVSPNKKKKPNAKPSFVLILSIILSAVCIMFLFAVNTLLLSTDFSKISELLCNVLSPIAVIFGIPIWALIRMLLFKKFID
ncbi:MAG: helix-turn-helix transcriptional regulator [Clostridia bacterium]